MRSIRKATIVDLPGVMKCVNDAKRFLRDSGSTQWNGDDGYPRVTDMVNDINLSRLYLCIDNDEIAGICAFLGEEPEYQNLYGKWAVETDNYLTIHRIAVNEDFRGTGISKELFIYAEEFAKKNNMDSVRVDTHEKNKIVQSLANDMGYTLCGHVIYKRIKDEPKRLVYEKRVK